MKNELSGMGGTPANHTKTRWQNWSIPIEPQNKRQAKGIASIFLMDMQKSPADGLPA